MPEPIERHPLTSQPIKTRLCLKCGVPMLVTRIEPATEVDHEVRTCECLASKVSQTVPVRFR
jgi:hypothetical protein